ncbi:4-hydroxy-3-methylbut-2-enyl diphosphate reductase [Nocardia pseudobrasiliensis]|uniref:4-hydroxy-3-methylbut-2-enyl diphosphate reductase n=1 Tax=Nocardia pseudobrasiliensis TaxID=45979 RepID=A0A370I854_9NOCA|nr:4-hydroxy-3-methylbut-2-enyl diphosphate reductase [Nocardia pseudobrasiliensis]RDI66905.1 4-hydroxy-3-methylbut-2-enyl diphosphate reductase [Nocardia pseudobrasiliensis]
MERTVLLAAPRSLCAGVERAIATVARLLADPDREGPIYVRKQIVHNTRVVRELAARGAIFVDELDEVPMDATVVFSAHGVSPAVREQARRRGLTVVDATCPLVTKVHSEAKRFAARGDTVVLIGHAGHEEVEGTFGEAPEATVIVDTPAEAAALRVPDDSRVSYLTQTTLSIEETEATVAALRQRFPKLHGPASADICYASTNRQRAVEAISARSDLVLVVGSANSSNSQRMVEVARRQGIPAHLIDDASHIHDEWIEQARIIGLSAGASAPAVLVDGVIEELRRRGPVTVEELVIATETITFAAPSPLRRRP